MVHFDIGFFLVLQCTFRFENCKEKFNSNCPELLSNRLHVSLTEKSQIFILLREANIGHLALIYLIKTKTFRFEDMKPDPVHSSKN